MSSRLQREEQSGHQARNLQARLLLVLVRGRHSFIHSCFWTRHIAHEGDNLAVCYCIQIRNQQSGPARRGNDWLPLSAAAHMDERARCRSRRERAGFSTEKLPPLLLSFLPVVTRYRIFIAVLFFSTKSPTNLHRIFGSLAGLSETDNTV